MYSPPFYVLSHPADFDHCPRCYAAGQLTTTHIQDCRPLGHAEDVHSSTGTTPSSDSPPARKNCARRDNTHQVPASILTVSLAAGRLRLDRRRTVSPGADRRIPGGRSFAACLPLLSMYNRVDLPPLESRVRRLRGISKRIYSASGMKRASRANAVCRKLTTTALVAHSGRRLRRGSRDGAQYEDERAEDGRAGEAAAGGGGGQEQSRADGCTREVGE
ncbi:hypothetical protein K466DRAFT_387858 [Polyporus arcularius HHB13444]|uniref:Uncharacterized protein n=1 Tax=Polyporus arcularius HHB13444 TaxID=1314778 RepID=A0A5C3NV99_9APHY|nr:hypothetical protein K466DRAFT_387858 [Polyporus arcularius HHB13444]